MALSWTTFAIFIISFFSTRGAPLKDDPLVDKVEQIVNIINTYLEVNEQDQIQLPDYGNLSTDHILLTNLKLSNFSTMEFKEGPFVQQNLSQTNFNVTLRLQTFDYQFDFYMNSTDFQQQGHMTLTPQNNYYVIEGLVEIFENKSCNANLTFIDFTDYGEISVDIQPENIPRRGEIIEKIFSFISPSFILWSNYALENITSMPSFDEEISYIICQVLIS